MKAHLLYPDRDLDLEDRLPPRAEDLARDLDLATLVAAMAADDELVAQVATRVLLSPLTDPDEIRYRQGILQDFLDKPEVLQGLYGLVTEALAARKKLWGYSWSLSFRRPRSILSGARECLELFVGYLRKLRALADTYGPVVCSEGLSELFRSLQVDLSDEYLRVVNKQLERLHFRQGVLLSARLGKGNAGDSYVLRTPERDKPHWKERLGMAERSMYSFSIHPRDEAGAQALDELWERGVNEVANAVAQSADHIGDYLDSLRIELAFYVGCSSLAEKLSGAGQAICTPSLLPPGSRGLAFKGLSDPCLALRTGRPPVANDLDADNKPLVVVTGANSGGKSTFLRSAGLAQLMAQAGMFVAARSFRASPASGVFTHFPRREDASMTRGRLEEELARMGELARAIRPGALVLFNESFHSTNEREGSEIARQIARALAETASRAIFVSHQYDFARSFLGSREAVFLRARLGPDGRPDYHLLVAPPEASAYGPELYEEVFAGGQRS